MSVRGGGSKFQTRGSRKWGERFLSGLEQHMKLKETYPWLPFIRDSQVRARVPRDASLIMDARIKVKKKRK